MVAFMGHFCSSFNDISLTQGAIKSSSNRSCKRYQRGQISKKFSLGNCTFTIISTIIYNFFNFVPKRPLFMLSNQKEFIAIEDFLLVRFLFSRISLARLSSSWRGCWLVRSPRFWFCESSRPKAFKSIEIPHRFLLGLNKNYWIIELQSYITTEKVSLASPQMCHQIQGFLII